MEISREVSATSGILQMVDESVADESIGIPEANERPNGDL